MLIGLAAIVGLLLVNGFFVAAEFSLVRSRRPRLEAMGRAGDRKARRVLRAIAGLSRLLPAIQLGITLSSLALGALAQDTLGVPIAAALGAGPALELPVRVAVGAILAILAVTVVHVVFAELVPRAAAINHPEGMSRWLVPPLLAFAWLARPVTALVSALASAALRLFGLRRETSMDSLQSAEELRLLVEQSHESGLLPHEGATLLENVFDFSEKTVREVMTPRTELDALPLEATLDEAVAMVVDCGHSRYPVYDGSIDDIVGVVLAKDLLPLLRERPVDFSLAAVMRPLHVVPGTRDVEDVLADFQRLKEHMAVVLDEYGGTAGVVTMEDLLEEIVGEILDEYDELPSAAAPGSDDDVCVPGTMHVGELNERFGLEVPEGDYTTVAGFIFTTLGRLPVVGDSIAAANARFTVREMDGRRIATLAVDLHSLGDRRERERIAGEPRDTG